MARLAACVFAACTATRIGEVSGCRIRDIDTETWPWRLRRQTTPGPGGMRDKRTKGKRARTIPLIAEDRPLILARINNARARVECELANASAEERHDALLDARLFVGPRGGRIATGVLRKATHWDEVVARLGFEHLRRHDLRHTGLTWFADAGVPLHRLQRIARAHRSADHPAVPTPGCRGPTRRRRETLATPSGRKWSQSGPNPTNSPVAANPLRRRSEGISACRADRI
ncbi:tyrosine-type recombinase/integrase [Nocardia sp. NPDC050793]|uniref:tyrosine-type recombinase/integrase n=1 Tax=Nocardia sp. NPDC050793 TaxID=3155159 RepID=UPI0033DBBF42